MDGTKAYFELKELQKQERKRKGQEKRLFSRYHIKRHLVICTKPKLIFEEGNYQPKLNVFENLELNGIKVPKEITSLALKVSTRSKMR